MSDHAPPPCRFAGEHEPRVVRGRHQAGCGQDATERGQGATESRPPYGLLSEGANAAQSGCEGCEPCREPHCSGDACRGRNHAATVCPDCLTAARDDLTAIRAMCGVLPTEAEHRGVESEAAMLTGPAADPEAWRYTAMSAMFGRVDDAYLTDCRDEAHPLWILAWIEQEWREALDQPTDLRVTIARSGDYIGRQLAHVAGLTVMPDGGQPPEFADAARRLRECRSHLEDVLHDGERDEKGAPCPMCGKAALVKDYGDTEADDRWHCPNSKCDQWWTEADYRAKVDGIYLGVAEALTISDLAIRTRVPVGRLRTWAAPTRVSQGGILFDSEPKLKPIGRTPSGRKLYPVEIAEQLRGFGMYGICVVHDCSNLLDAGHDLGVCDSCGMRIARRYRVQIFAEAHARETMPDLFAGHEQPSGTSFVYYAKIYDHIKIGYTTNVRGRISALRITADDILALEPGGRDVEQRRHHEFDHLRISKRWENFRPESDLMEHIGHLRDEHGLPTWLRAPRRGRNGPVVVRGHAK